MGHNTPSSLSAPPMAHACACQMLTRSSPGPHQSIPTAQATLPPYKPESLAGVSRLALSVSLIFLTVAVVLLWRGWWSLMDAYLMRSWVSLVIGILLTLGHFFVRPMLPACGKDDARDPCRFVR